VMGILGRHQRDTCPKSGDFVCAWWWWRKRVWSHHWIWFILV
jgi:hypothetical protein